MSQSLSPPFPTICAAPPEHEQWFACTKPRRLRSSMVPPTHPRSPNALHDRPPEKDIWPIPKSLQTKRPRCPSPTPPVSILRTRTRIPLPLLIDSMSYVHDSADPRPSPPRPPEPKSSKSRARNTSSNQYTSSVSPNVALAWDPALPYNGLAPPYNPALGMPFTGRLPPVGKSMDPAPRKSSKSKDKDRDRNSHRRHERERPSDTHGWKASREAGRDPYEPRPVYHAPALGRGYKEHPDENDMLPEASSHRRHRTEDDATTLMVNRIFHPSPIPT